MSVICPADKFRYPEAEVLAQPYEFYAAMRSGSPVYQVPGTNVFIVGSYDLALEASRHPDIFTSKRVWMASDDPAVAEIRAKGFPDSNSLTATDPPEHNHFRSLAMKVFSARRFAALEPQVRATANRLIDSFIADGHADLQLQYATPLPLYVIVDLLGVDHADAVDLKRWSDDYSEALASTSSVLPRHRVLECAQSLTDMQLYFSRKIKEKEVALGDDTISELIRSNNIAREPASHIELVDIIRIFLIGGNETTALSIGTLMHNLLKVPERFERLKANPALISKAIEEGLRHESPAQWSGRNTTTDTVLGGMPIPAGSRVYLNWGSANRDAAKFPEKADEFDLDRDNISAHMAFGSGPHFCIGSPLARLEMRITLELMIDRLKNLRIAPHSEIRFHAHPILRGIEHLHVEFDAA